MSIQLSNKLSAAAQKDIRELKTKIQAFKEGRLPEERFKAYRLTRGVYGQRQVGVQMFRIKIPFGKITADQLIRIADLSERYATGNLHTTTRQNIQYHYVKVEDSPAIWTGLEEVGVTAREACGNTVRTVTGSAKAGIDPDEVFDVSPYAQAVSDYFLRNPICQDMGRKIKMAFSSSAKDSAFTYFHDLGFTPVLKEGERGFKVLIGGGLGAQPFVAKPLYDFLEEEKLIPLIEAVLRVFDRHGERKRRHKARLKFLLDEKRGMGLATFLQHVEDERKTLPFSTYPIKADQAKIKPPISDWPSVSPKDEKAYVLWEKTNVFPQKQAGFYGVQIKLPLGNIQAEEARLLAEVARQYAADDIRITVNQGFLLRFVPQKALPHLYNALQNIGLASPGFDTIADITACPGTDTCNLGMSNSTGLAARLEHQILADYEDLLIESDIRIKISGCMNGCGQHIAAQIGYHGSSIKNKGRVVPAMQIVLGGGVEADGKGHIADKVIKIPTKRILDSVDVLLNNFSELSLDNETFIQYYLRQGKKYFYKLLKPLADLSTLTEEDYQDWDAKQDFELAVGVGECAGVMVDLVGTIIQDATDKIADAQEAITEKAWSGAIYNAYSAYVIGAKALLLSIDVTCNTQIGILTDFEKHFLGNEILGVDESFVESVLLLRKNEPEIDFSRFYLQGAMDFVERVKDFRTKQLAQKEDKEVVSNYYKA